MQHVLLGCGVLQVVQAVVGLVAIQMVDFPGKPAFRGAMVGKLDQAMHQDLTPSNFYHVISTRSFVSISDCTIESTAATHIADLPASSTSCCHMWFDGLLHVRKHRSGAPNAGPKEWNQQVLSLAWSAMPMNHGWRGGPHALRCGSCETPLRDRAWGLH